VSIYELYNLEYYVEKGASYVLSASAGITNVVSGSTDAEDRMTPLVALKYINGGSTDRRQNSYDYYDGWEGTLAFLIVTNRDINSAKDNEYLSKIRYYFSNPYWMNSGSVLPYHSVDNLKEEGTVKGLSNDENLDDTTVTFKCNVYIRPEAWASASL
jgi:hypothetical protein